MSQKLFFLIFFSFLTISYQLNCRNYYDETCGGHNSNYNLKCVKYTGDQKCSEYEYDEGCTMTAGKTCQKADTSGSYHCLLIDDGKVPKCKRINLDTNCEIDSNGDCSAKSGATIETGKKCKPSNDGKECSLQQMECSDYINNCNQHGENCIKIKKTSGVISFTQCQIVKVDSKCEIDSNGDCKGKASGGPEAYEKCTFNSLYTECKLINRECSEIEDTTKCSSCKTSNQCKKIKYNGATKCLNVEINTSCKINNNDECVKSSDSDTNKCQLNYYNSSYSACEYYNVDQKCVLGDGLTCSDGTSLTDEEKKKYKCDWVVKSNTNKKCEPRAKNCYYDYNSDADTCNAETNCAYIESWRQCIPIESNDENCEKKANGECSAKEGKASSFSEYEKCGYVEKDDDNIYKCQKTYKKCSEYTDQAKCNNAPEVDEKKCYYSESKCKTVYLNNYDYCTWNSQNGECEEKSSGKLSPYEKCYKYEPTGYDYYDYINCGLRDKSCSDYSESNCGNYSPEVKLCFNLEGHYCKEIKIDSQCSINGNNECTGNNCKFDEDKDRCYYQEESNASLLKMSQFILLMLFFMF